uniref:Fanconi anemia group D2 protein n=1 Tax=Panagrellus redivivus TaxID=6233 RepID=A0A7E4V8P9_PANRE
MSSDSDSDSDSGTIYDSVRRIKSLQVNTTVHVKTAELTITKELEKTLTDNFHTLDFNRIADKVIASFDDPKKCSASCKWIEILAQNGILNKVSRDRLRLIFETMFHKLMNCITADEGVLPMLETISATFKAMPEGIFIPNDMSGIVDEKDVEKFTNLITPGTVYTPQVVQIISGLLENKELRYRIVSALDVTVTLFSQLTDNFPERHKAAGYGLMNLLCRDDFVRVHTDHVDDFLDMLEQQRSEELIYQVLSILSRITVFKTKFTIHFIRAKGVDVCVHLLDHKSTRVVQKAIDCIANATIVANKAKDFPRLPYDRICKLIGGDELLITDGVLTCFTNLCQNNVRAARDLVLSHDIVFVTMRILETLENPENSSDFKTRMDRNETRESALLLLKELTYPVNTSLSIRVCKQITSIYDWCLRLCNVFKYYDASYNHLVMSILYSIVFNCPASHVEILDRKIESNKDQSATAFDMIFGRILLSRDIIAKIRPWSHKCWMFTIKPQLKPGYRAFVEDIFSCGCNLLLVLVEKNAIARKTIIRITNSPSLTPFKHLDTYVKTRDYEVLTELLKFGNSFALLAPKAVKKWGENRNIVQPARRLAKKNVSAVNKLVVKFLRHIEN